MIVVFIGPDGVGKTSVINRLMNSEVIKSNFDKIFYFHTFFPILPPLRSIISKLPFFKSKRVESTDNTIKNLIPISSPKCLIYPFYYGLNNILGHLWILRQSINSKILVFFDRYYYEYYIQPSFKNCPKRILDFFIKIIPKADLLVFLKSEPEVIYRRKQDLPIEEIKKQLLKCEEITNNSKVGIVIENRNLSETVKLIETKILELTKR